MGDYIPSNDEQLKSWITNFLSVLETVIADFGLTAADLVDLQNTRTSYAAAVDDYIIKEKAARSACQVKREQRSDLVGLTRPLVARINNHPAMDNGLRVSLGLNPRSVAQMTLPIEELMPMVLAEASLGQVTVHWGPNPGNERENGKPAGVRGGNVYRKRTGDADFQLVAFTTKSPFYDTVAGNAADYSYIVRYQGSKSTDLSQQSEPATVAARGDMAA